MKIPSKSVSALSALFLSGALPASGATFQFYKLSRQPSSNAADFKPNNGSVLAGDIVSTVGGNLEFTSDGLTLNASGTRRGNPAAVVQDSENGWTATKGAGLGVYKNLGTPQNPLDTSDDNITSKEVLTIIFDQEVTLERIDLRAEGHGITGWSANSTFLLNGTPTLLPEGTGFLNVNLTGTQFTFGFNDALNTAGRRMGDQFYLAALTATPRIEKSIPEGGASLTMLGLSLSGLGLVRSRLRK